MLSLGYVSLATVVCVALSQPESTFVNYCTPTEDCWPCAPDIRAFAATLSSPDILIDNWNEKFDLAADVGNHYLWRKPGWVVDVQTLEDVQKAVRFGRKHRLRLSIVSSGHDFAGRNTGTASLMINTRNMKAKRVYPADANSPTGSSLWAEPACNMGEIFAEVDRYGLVAVGGNAHGVSVSGWTLGGGHSQLSRKYGLGVDNVLSFEVVLADGSVANVSANGTYIIDANNNPVEAPDNDLWWALRGGGGSTFAVMTALHIKLFPAATGYVSTFLTYPIWGENMYWLDEPVNNTGEQVLDFFYKDLLWRLPDTWGGYVMIYTGPVDLTWLYPGYSQLGSVQFTLFHYGPWEEAMNGLQPLIDFHPEWRLANDLFNFSTYLEMNEGGVNDILNGNTYIVNRLHQEEYLKAGAITEVYKNYIQDFDEDSFQFSCTLAHLGHATVTPGPEDTSISPELRKAYISNSCGTAWGAGETGDYQRLAIKDFDSNFLQQAGDGVYYNEPDTDLVNWKSDFWGSNYARLAEIKQRYDPDGYFRCSHCVGSDVPFTGITIP
ncbi:unnamed protein product [Owenia fusiformis]|uniref:FAD-binding PCMH-type domain-containing protein n=1 Tax=Owenia fusiformis TaxID=6347 RepID=A0A8J1Y3N3_OWEFU|nr:unnamed protein product [Owenia fusiformis]